MARKRSEQSRLIEFFMRAPLEEAKLALGIVAEIVRQRDPAVASKAKAKPKTKAAAVAGALLAVDKLATGGKGDGTGD